MPVATRKIVEKNQRTDEFFQEKLEHILEWLIKLRQIEKKNGR